jgi:hypothetical protein
MVALWNMWPSIGVMSNQAAAAYLSISKFSQMPHGWIPELLHLRLSAPPPPGYSTTLMCTFSEQKNKIELNPLITTSVHMTPHL